MLLHVSLLQAVRKRMRLSMVDSALMVMINLLNFISFQFTKSITLFTSSFYTSNEITRP